ncbi:MAG: flagellar protein FlgN [Deltaproteobacteria bacterium]|nr:flagellar protein FlgN [Deltaproteobacteria bacterium]
MEALLEQLLAVLQREIILYGDLHGLLEDELARDGEMTSKALLQCQGAKNAKAKAIGVLETERQALVEKIAGSRGLQGEELTLRNLAAAAPDPLGKALMDCHGRLMELVEQIQAGAQRTSQNAAARLKAVNATLETIKEAVRTNKTYTGQGRINSQPPAMRHISV